MNINMTLALLRVFLPQPRKPGSGHSQIFQARALAQPAVFRVFSSTAEDTMLW
jgi:hypothetical protein